MMLTIGNINVDIICKIPRLPTPDDKVIASNVIIVPGGGACNFAVGLKRLGTDVALFGHVGNDNNGNICLESLKNEEIDISRVVIEDNNSTGFVIILVEKDGQTMKIGYREANALLSQKEITDELLKNFSWIHLSSVSSPIALKVAKVCRKLEIGASIDFGGELMNESSEILQNIVDNFSIVFMNKIAFRKTFNDSINPNSLSSAQKSKCDILNVTNGVKGSFIVTEEEVFRIPIWEVPVVDTTGAGDAYAAGFLHYYLKKNLPLSSCGEYAAACAALQITLTNARDGMPKKNEVEEFIVNKRRNKFGVIYET